MAVYVPSVQDRLSEALLSVIGQANAIKAQKDQLETTLGFEREKLDTQKDISIAGIQAGKEANILQLIGLGMTNKSNERSTRMQVAGQYWMNKDTNLTNIKMTEINKQLGIRTAEIGRDATLGSAKINADTEKWIAEQGNLVALKLQELIGAQDMEKIEKGSKAEKDMILFKKNIREKTTQGLIGIRNKVIDKRAAAKVTEAGGDWGMMDEDLRERWRDSVSESVDSDMARARGALARAPMINKSLEDIGDEDLQEMATVFKEDPEYKDLNESQKAIALTMLRDELETRAYMQMAKKGLVPTQEAE